MDNLLQKAVESTRAAGEAIMSYYQSALEVRDKSPDNPLTEADLAADRLLHEQLLDLLPEAGWLSEETVDSPERLQRRYAWVVDPLDGTKEFVMGIPEFSVSVALVEAGEPILGVVFNPAKDELYCGYRDSGLTFNGRPTTASTRTTLSGAAVDASRSEMKRGEFEPFTDLVQLKIVGSIAYKLARVSAGQADATWSRGPKNEWDICAGAFLISAAGGRCVNLNNQPFTFNQPNPKVNGIIADNGHLHQAIIDALAPHGAARLK